MKELFNELEVNENPKVLLDTCFVYYMLKHNKEKEMKGMSITTFNAQELLLTDHKVSDDLRHKLRKWLKKKEITIVKTPVNPGEWKKEEEYIKSVDSKLLQLIPDKSDAVLLAAAVKFNANVLTKDRHDIYSAALNNHLSKIKVAKEIKDLN